MSPKALFLQSMIAANVALPLAMSYGLGWVPGSWPRLTAFWICVIILFTVNQYIGQRLPEFRKWVWGMQALNLLSTVFLGAVAFISGASILLYFATQAFD